ncbi:MAG TPA: hypothetical protein VLX28_09430 [Thermoanaerobaculia bacterium]|nr:hypothetical protein [Thermoanaerobaculia bacterium]
MQRNLATRSLILAILAASVLAATACQKADQAPPAGSTAAAPAGQSAPPATSTSTASAPAPKVQVCKLLSAAEVSAVMGKKLIQDGCSYGLDPADKEKEMADGQAQLAKSQQRAAAGDMNGFVKGMMQGQKTMGSSIGNQMTITVDASRDDQTEEQVKAIYAKTGGVVRGALAPEKHGLNGVIEGLDEVSGVGDWAFATNVASVNMGMGFSERGRLLEARKGPWHVTIGATVAPDPGVAALDGHLADLARALIAKL